MSDGLKSHIRTWWPIALGQVATMLVALLAERFGVEISGEVAYAFTSAVVTALVYSLGRFLETRQNSFLRGVGTFILSLGLVPDKPTYEPQRVAWDGTPVRR